MKVRNIFFILTLLGVIAACDDNTQDIGINVTDKMDHMEISTDTFDITTRSIAIDSVIARTTVGYIGKVRDPETGTYVTGNYMTQFHTFENYDLPETNKMESLDENGEIIADSVELRLFYRNFYGDPLSTMRLTAYELDRPMEENENYFSNYDPQKEGFISESTFRQDKVYTLADQNVSSTLRASSDYTPNIRIRLDKPYTDREGKIYNNYGTYVLRKYYENSDNFKNSYNFTHRVVPGFYFQNSGGLGAMAEIFATQLNIYFRYNTSADTVAVGSVQFTCTEEVLQTTNITSDKATIRRLAADNTCTYIKSPSGIFTEITIPVEDIMKGHEKDSLNTAHLKLHRLNDLQLSQYSLKPPTTLLILPVDSVDSFFKKQEVCNYKTSFTATYSSSANGYTFENISNLVKEMYRNRHTSDNWNKAVLIPVVTQLNSNSEMTSCQHDLSMKSTRLIGGINNPNPPIKMSIIYGKFE